MYPRRRFAIIFCLLAVKTGDGCFAQSPDPADTFLQRYVRGVRPVIDYYSHVRLRARCTSTYLKPARTISHEYNYSANGLLLRLDELNRSGFSGVQTRVADPVTNGFLVSREQGRQSYVFGGPGRLDYETKTMYLRLFAPLPSNIYCTGGLEFTEYFRLPGLKIVEVTEVLQAGREHEPEVQVVFERPWGKGKKQQGIIRFSAIDWTLRHRTLGLSGDPEKGVLDIEYGKREDGVPCVSRSVERVYDKNGIVVETHTVEILELRHEIVPESEFKLSAFGISEAGLQPVIAPIYYVQLAAVVILVASLLWWQGKRSRKRRKLRDTGDSSHAAQSPP